MRSFEDFCRTAAGFSPYDYQRRLAEHGLPEVLHVPTGAGKTAAAILPWLYRRRRAAPSVRRDTPRRLVLAFPLKTLVEQTAERVGEWLTALGVADDVPLHVFMGGERSHFEQWQHHADGDAVLVGTIDMLLSRALMRGYAMSRWNWPIDFALLNNDCQWVFDEVQLMGPGLPTSRQLQAFRERMGTVRPVRTMWMSATVDLEALGTVDAPHVHRVFTLNVEDLSDDGLRGRVEATRQVARLAGGETADAIVDAHREHATGARTLVFVNTVRRAQVLYDDIVGCEHEADVVLIHSRFRPPDRAAATEAALEEPGSHGTIVVSTQALEAGVDISSSLLVTEAATWPSIVQRAGRCNRYGETHDARLLWMEPEAAAPYEEDEVASAVDALMSLEGHRVTGQQLASMEVETAPRVPLVLRRKDLLELFDTTPDLSGNDVDVSRFIREVDPVDANLAWRELKDGSTVPWRLPDDTPMPDRDELCPAPVGDLRSRVGRRGQHPVWRFDHVAEAWTRVDNPGDVRPGDRLLADVSLGYYDAERGWDRGVRAAVAPVELDRETQTETAEAVGDDPQSRLGVWVELSDHLDHVEQQARRLVQGLEHPLSGALEAAVVRAAALHDIGKAHPVFQRTMRSSAGEDERDRAETGGPWAKSSRARYARHERTGFRHGLAGALALMEPQADRLLDDLGERELAIYLVGAHHGRARLGIRSLANESDCEDGGQRPVLGVCPGDMLPAIDTPAGRLEEVVLDLEPASLGGERSWTRRALRLRDRQDLGAFRLAFLEALVRIADWRASRAEEQGL